MPLTQKRNEPPFAPRGQTPAAKLGTCRQCRAHDLGQPGRGAVPVFRRRVGAAARHAGLARRAARRSGGDPRPGAAAGPPPDAPGAVRSQAAAGGGFPAGPIRSPKSPTRWKSIAFAVCADRISGQRTANFRNMLNQLGQCGGPEPHSTNNAEGRLTRGRRCLKLNPLRRRWLGYGFAGCSCAASSRRPAKPRVEPAAISLPAGLRAARRTGPAPRASARRCR